MEITINSKAVRTFGNIKYIDIDNLTVSCVTRKFIYYEINWRNVLMLIDMSDRSKKFSTLIIEKDNNAYLLRDTTTSLLNTHLAGELHLNECFNNSISANLGLKQKYSYVTSQGSFIPLTAGNKSRTHSWINVDTVCFSQPYGMHNKVLFFDDNDNLPLALGTTIYYINSKLDEVRRKKDYVIHYYELANRSIDRIRYNNHNSPFCRIRTREFFNENTIKRINLGTAWRLKERYDKKNKGM